MTHPNVITFGCRLNTYESEVIKEIAQNPALKDTVIINTCAVTAEAERQARQKIRQIKRQNPELRVVVTGCSVQTNPKSYADMPEVDQVLGNLEKTKVESYLAPERFQVQDIMAVREVAHHLVSGFEGRVRAFVQVQNGCNHRCTFCIIPYGRGNSRSVPVGEIVAQVAHLVSQGYQEIVLTGVDITAYGEDLPGTPSLGQMLQRLLKAVPQLPRLRLSSLDPVELDEAFWAVFATEPRLMPHLHISLQAGDDMILKRMKRRHLRHHILEMCDRARQVRPDVVFGADIIAGFPTETPEMFENTYAIVADAGLTHLHVFPYSPRPGTPAARMPQVPKAIIKERAAALRAAGDVALQTYLQTQIGQVQSVVMETEQMGKTPHYVSVMLDQPQTVGAMIDVRITGVQAGKLEGEIA